MNNKEIDFWISKGKYKVTETKKYTIWLSGLLSYGGGKNDIEGFVSCFFDGILDFNKIIGWFRIVIFNKEEKKWYLFGDNSNSQHFFYDVETGEFSDSMLFIKQKRRSDVTPDYMAIGELLGLGFTSEEKTVVNEIKRTDKDFFYIYDGVAISKESKKLRNLCDMDQQLDIFDIIEQLKSKVEDAKIAAVCTGGTDSRAVIGGLMSALSGNVYSFVITGHEDNPDIGVARRISETLHVPLKVISPKIIDENHLIQGYNFTDGQYDTVLSYRHCLKAQWEIEEGIKFEFGGLAGEFYKNVFCQPIRWFGKKKDADFYFNHFLRPNIQTQKWVGDALKKANSGKSNDRLKRISQNVEAEKTLLEKGNRVGFDILAWKSGAITNGYASIATKIDPLMDRQLCGWASHDNSLSHSMHRWQRKQVEKNCKEIARIPTDQGYTCSLGLFLYTKDSFKKIFFYFDRVLNRVRRKIGLGFKSMEQRFWDVDYNNARNTAIWAKSVKTLKSNGIIAYEACEEDIPLKYTGWLITLGLMLAE